MYLTLSADLKSVYCAKRSKENFTHQLQSRTQDCLRHEQKSNRVVKYDQVYIIRLEDKESLNNDAPVAWDGTSLTSDQFGPDGSRDGSHTILASWDMNVLAKVTDPAYRTYNSSSAYRRKRVVS